MKKPLSALPALLLVNGFEWLPLAFEHTLAYLELPLHHRDPFDRMLIAQATVENLTIITRDPQFEVYGASLLW